MKLGVVHMNLTGWPAENAPMDLDLEEGLEYATKIGLRAMEVGVAGLWNRRYCDPQHLLAGGQGEIDRWKDTLARHDIEVFSMGGHGEPLSPDRKVRERYSEEFRTACEFMERAGLVRLSVAGGVPEGAEGDTAPNWVGFAEWPFLRDILECQWEKRLIPRWRELGKIAADHGVTLCFELMAGDMLFNPPALKRLHEEIGPVIACNFDPSHMWYQGIDPIDALRDIGPLVQTVHVEDTIIHGPQVRERGWMDPGVGGRPDQRAWTFAPPGFGHDEAFWREFLSTLRSIGYDGALNFEVECPFLSVKEGLEKSVAFLKPILFEEADSSKES